MTRGQRILRVSVLLAWMLLITIWSDQSTLPIDAPVVRSVFLNLQHRLAHLVAFGLLGLLGGWAFEGSRRSTILAIALTAVFGAADELHQSFVPGRKPGVDDWLFDIFSASVALWLWPRLKLRQPSLATVAPIVVGAIFTLGVVLLITPRLSRPAALSGLGRLEQLAIQELRVAHHLVD